MDVPIVDLAQEIVAQFRCKWDDHTTTPDLLTVFRLPGRLSQHPSRYSKWLLFVSVEQLEKQTSFVWMKKIIVSVCILSSFWLQSLYYLLVLF